MADLDNRRHLTVAQTAEVFGVSADTIRRWDREGIITSTRTLKGHRRFALTEIERVRGQR